MTPLRIGLNGFGRIGRAITRIALDRSLPIVAVNTAHTEASMMAYLLQYDSVYRTFHKPVRAKADGFIVGSQSITSFNDADPATIPWEKHGVNVVIDATGAFKKRDDLSKHLRGTVKKVILTAPTDDDTISHIVLGANDDKFDFEKEDIISNASCTTNCAAVMTRVLDDHFKIISGYLTTVHAYTSSQQLLDNSSDKKTRSRAATLSIIPTTTGAAAAVCKTTSCEPGRLGAVALRVPVPTGSLTDMSVNVEKKTTALEIHEIFKKEAEGRLKGILRFEEEPLVSADFIGSPYSCIYDANYTQVLNGNFLKVFGWYDNEWGYSTRVVDLLEKLSNYI